jgi:hypothetical protein
MPSWSVSDRAGTLVLNASQGPQNVGTNSTIVYWSLYLYCYNGSSYQSSPAVVWSTSTDGLNDNGTYVYDFRGTTEKFIASGSRTVTHSADGTRSVVFGGATADTGSQAGGAMGVSGTMTLTTIARATQPTVSPASGNTAAIFTIGHAAASSAFYHDVAYSLDSGGSYTAIATNVAGPTVSTSWTPAHSLLPYSTSATAIIRLITRASSGGTIIGTKTVNLPLTVPASVKPTVSSVAWTDGQTSGPNMPTLMGGAGRFVRGWSRLKPAITSTPGAGAASITASSVTVNAQSTPNNTAFATPVSLAGSVPFSASATDSRGVSSAPLMGNVTVLPYSFPALPTPVVVRTSDAGGTTPSPTGTYLAITPNATVSSLSFSGSQRNLLEWRVRTKPTGGSYTLRQDWTSIGVVGGTAWASKYIPSGAPYAASSEFVVEVSVRDVFGKNGFNAGSTVVTREVLVASEEIFMDRDANNGVGIKKYRQQGALDVNGDIYMNNQLVASGGRVAVQNNLGSNPNLDLLTDTGWYSGYGWAEFGGGIGTIEVNRYSADWITQTLTTVEDRPRIYSRCRYYGTTWSPWRLSNDVNRIATGSWNNYYDENATYDAPNLADAPFAGYWFYVTVKVHAYGDWAEQEASLLNETDPRNVQRKWRRIRNGSSGAWTAWERIDGGTYERRAAGRATTSASSDITVTYPSGRFTATPIVTLTAWGTPNILTARLTSSSVSSFTASAYTSFGTRVAASLEWHALAAE